MPDYDITGPRLKIKRAEKHISELDAVLTAFLAKKPYRVLIEADHGTFEVATLVNEKIPEEIPLIIGDATHNLRAALDLLACALIHRGGKDPEKAQFPFGRTIDTFEDGVKELVGVDAKIIATIINMLHPNTRNAHGGRLAALHDLDIMDKHKLIIPTTRVMSQAFEQIRIGGRPIATGVGFFLSEEIGRHRHISMGGVTGKVEYEANPSAEIKIVFGKDSPFSGEEVVDALNATKTLVALTVETLWAIQ